MHDEDVNTTRRFTHYCRAQSKDGRVCSLYLDHESEEHVENHGKSRWKDGE